ncbi:cyclase family protein [Actinomadura chibensis]|uniref:cyclase family protein n=1 Tax=Actinomadura chibensis TaxID=392828 RepID=UPI000A59D9A4|nr:cyclase family protein [Actinomadura chibensis]
MTAGTRRGDLRKREHTRASVEELAVRHRTWGVWGPDDELGAPNRVTAEKVLAAVREVRKGAVFSLALPLDRSGPQGAGSLRANPQHVMLVLPTDPWPGENPLQRFSDDAVYMPLQSGTQWDGLCHAFYDGRTYNGRGTSSVTANQGAKFNSVTNLKDRAVGRGVLLDVARWSGHDHLPTDASIQAEDLARCAADQGVEVGEGDFVLVRTGELARVREAGSWGRYAGGPAPGLGVSAAEFLCSRRVSGVASDTWGLEALPYETSDLIAPLHAILLVNAGIYIGEMWDLEALAGDCAADGGYAFLLAAQPLTITGAVGSPINPVAIK